MCGIAGLIDLDQDRVPDLEILQRMAQAIRHRGPDEEGYCQEAGLGLASRRLSIVGLQDGRQPIDNEDGSVTVVFNGELFDHRLMRGELESRGHLFRTHTDTELLPHLWEEYGEGMLERLRGQFAFALWDRRERRLLLARDRVGICPLFWTVQSAHDGGRWLLFASEIKALFASGMVPARADLGGLSHIFTFMGIPGPTTCFEGIHLLEPGRSLQIRQRSARGVDLESTKPYWEIDFPDQGQEQDPRETLPSAQPGLNSSVVDEFEHLLLKAVDRRLRADVPVVAYLSGGVDSSMVVALASKLLGRPIPTFTVAVQSQDFDETSAAQTVARYFGAELVLTPYSEADLRDAYPELIYAAEMPVIDTSTGGLMRLAESVHSHGFKVALAGEGPDEFLGGYSWFKTHRLMKALDIIPNVPMSRWLRNLFCRLSGQPVYARQVIERGQRAVGGHNGWLDFYGLIGMAKERFFHPDVKRALQGRVALEEVNLPERIHAWHPFHRSLAVGIRFHLAGHLLAAKGDRIAMRSSVETRYPFLDEDLVTFMNQLHPRWKLRGFQDKYLLRRVAARWLPREVAQRAKQMFRASQDSFRLDLPSKGRPETPAWVEQVLSHESLIRTGYFDSQAVRTWRKLLPRMRPSLGRLSVALGLTAVAATQLWHHLFIGGDLADLPRGR